MHIDAGNGFGGGWNKPSRDQSISDAPNGAGGRAYFMSSAVAAPRPPRVREAGPIVTAFHAVRRTVLPTFALLIALAAIFLYGADRVEGFDQLTHNSPALNPSIWLHWGMVLVPFAFLALHIANRRYGPGIALAQIAAA